MPDNERPPRPDVRNTSPADPTPEEESAKVDSEEPTAEELTAEERARLSEEALRLLGGGTPLSKEELAEDPYINYRQ